MSELLTAEIGGMQWWAGTRQFPSAGAAKAAFTYLHDYGQSQQGALHVGVYRHAEPGKPVDHVTVVGHVHHGVVEALELLDELGGKVVELHPELLTRLVLRRAKVVMAMEGAPSGAYRFPHPGAGVSIDEEGNAVDR